MSTSEGGGAIENISFASKVIGAMWIIKEQEDELDLQMFSSLNLLWAEILRRLLNAWEWNLLLV